MAVNEKANVNVTVNNEQAKSELKEIQNELSRIKQLRKEALEKGDVKGFQQLNKEFQKAGREAKRLEREINGVEATLRNINGASLNDLRNAERALTAETSKLNRETKVYTQKTALLKKVKAEIAGIRNETRQSVSWTSRLSDGFNKYFGVITAGAASVAGLIMAGRKAVDTFNQFEERVDNLSALTGLEGEQLQWLSDTAKETSVATVEGNIRIKQSADAIVDAYTKVGSQRPELLKNKEALHAVTQDAIILSEAAKTDLEPAVAGLTMALNQLGYESNQSRRVINTMAAGAKEGAAGIPYLTEAYEKSGTTARLMHIEVEQLTGVIEAVAPSYSKASLAGNSFDKVLLKMKANNIGYVNGQFNLIAAIEELEKRYASGESSAELFGVEHAKMGELLVMNKDEILRYTDAVTGTEIALEQAAKNTDNNAAKLAQAKNRAALMRIELGEKLAPVLTHVVSTGSLMLKFLSKSIDFVGKHKTAIISVTAAIAAYTIGLQLANAESKMRIFLSKAGAVAEKVWGTAVGIATGKIKLATIAQRIWNMVQKANPILLLASVLIGATIALAGFIKKMGQQTAAQKALNDVTKEAQKATIEQKMQVEDLMKFAKDETKSLEERKKALDELNKISPEYFGNLSLETINTQDAKKATDDYIKSLEEKALVEAIDNEIAELRKQNAEAEIDGTKGKVKWHQTLLNMVLNGNNVQKMAEKQVKTSIKNKQKADEEYNSVLEALMKKRQEILGKDLSINGEDDGEEDDGEEGEGKKTTRIDALEKSYKKEQLLLKQQLANKEITEDEYRLRLLDAEARFLSQKIALQKKAGEETIDTESKLLDVQMKLKSEWVSINEKANKAVEDSIDAMLENDFENMNEANQAEVDATLEKYNRFIELREQFGQYEISDEQRQKAELDALEEAWQTGAITSWEAYERAKADITAKYAKGRFEKEKQYLDAAADITNGVSNLFQNLKDAELAKAGENTKEKEKIEKKYAKTQKGIAIGQAVISGAQSILQLWSNESVLPSPANEIYKGAMSLVIAGITAAQIATISNQQFSKGGFTSPGGKNEPAGIVHKGEFVASQDAVKNPTVNSVLSMIDIAQKNGSVARLDLSQVMGTYRGFAAGGYTSKVPQPGAPAQTGRVEVVQQADPEQKAINNAMLALLAKLDRDGVRSDINAREVFAKNAEYDKHVSASEY